MTRRVFTPRLHLLIWIAIVYLGALPCPSHGGAPLRNIQPSDGNVVVWLRDIAARVETKDDVFDLSDPRHEISQLKKSADDAFGTQPWTVIKAKDAKGVLDLRWSIRNNSAGRILVQLACSNRSDKPIHIDRFIVLDGFRPDAWDGGYALNFGVHGVSPLEKDVELGGIYATAANRPAFTGAFVATSHYLGIVNVKPVDGGLRVTAINPGDGIRLPPGAKRESEPVWMSPGRHPSVELERWGDLAGQWNNVRFSFGPSVNWCTWYSGLNNWKDKENSVFEQFVLANIPLLAETFAHYGLKMIRMTENSLGRKQGDWPLVTSAIPNGYTEMARSMEKHGMIPGFWADVHRVNIESQTFADHPDGLLKMPTANHNFLQVRVRIMEPTDSLTRRLTAPPIIIISLRDVSGTPATGLVSSII